MKCLSCGKAAEDSLCEECINDLLAEPVLAASCLVGSTAGRLMENNSLALYANQDDFWTRENDESYFAMIEKASIPNLKKKDCSRLLRQIQALLLHTGVPLDLDLETEFLIREGDLSLVSISLDRLESVEERFESMGEYDLYLLAGNLFALMYIHKGENILSVLPSEVSEAYLGESEYYYKKAIGKDASQQEVWRNRGWLFVSSGRIKDAGESFKSALDIERRDERAWHGTAFVRFIQESYPEAIEAADRVIEMRFNAWEAWNIKGKSLEKMGRKDDALTCYDQALDIAADREEIWLNKGNLLTLLGNEKEATDCYEAALRLNPKAQLQDENIWFEKGHLLFAQARYDEASSAFKRVVEIDKENKAGWFWLGRSLFAKESYPQAAVAFKRVLSIEPWREANVYLGKSLHQMNDFSAAIEIFDQLLKEEKNSADAYILKGDAYRSMGKAVKANRCYDSALNIDQNNSSVWYRKGNLLEKAGKWGAAVQFYNTALQMDGENLDAHMGKSRILGEQGNYNEALRTLDRAMELAPMSSSVWYERGVVLSKMGRWGAAVQAFNRTIEIDPKNEDAGIRKAEMFSSNAKLDKAMESTKEVLKRLPESWNAWGMQAKIQSEMDLNQDAIESYEKALTINPENLGLWNEKGAILEKQGHLKEANECYDRVIVQDGENILALSSKAGLLLKAKQYEESYRYYDRLTKIAPEDVEYWFQKGVAQGQIGRYDDAVETLHFAVKLERGRKDVWQTMARFLYEAGRYEECLRSCDVLDELTGKSGITFIMRGKVLEQSGDLDKALSYFKKALGDEPNNKRLKKAIKRVELKKERAVAHGDVAPRTERAAPSSRRRTPR